VVDAEISCRYRTARAVPLPVLHQLSSWLKTSDSFPTHFLSQHCPLLHAAKEAQQTGSQALLRRLLTEGGLFQSFANECDDSFPPAPDTPAHHRPAALLNARRDLLLAALGDNPLQHLRQCMKAIQAATSSRPVHGRNSRRARPAS
jgi:hypothetical protein